MEERQRRIPQNVLEFLYLLHALASTEIGKRWYLIFYMSLEGTRQARAIDWNKEWEENAIRGAAFKITFPAYCSHGCRADRQQRLGVGR